MSVDSDCSLVSLVRDIGQKLHSHHLQLVTAESCTGGWIAQTATSIPGSSEWFWGAYVTYTNATKTRMLGVPEPLLNKYGAVSEQVALSMVEGALKHSDAGMAVSVTGLAGPGGGSDDMPVGTVWIGWQRRGNAAVATCHQFAGDRHAVRRAAVEAALEGIKKLI